MKMSQLYSPTLREVPTEAELPSHKFMLRAGLMRKSTAGVYTYLPLGYRVIKKIMEIIREEMDNSGGQEILLPIIQPSELWHETGRWEDYGEEMFKLEDRHGRQFCLGPTHEEIITALVKSDVRSYRQLPLRLYQIQNKYRDEIRPRFGVMRGREFIMKDLYSFDRDEQGLDESYRAMYDAYDRIFRRCGVNARPVEADAGAIGGDNTHEFMVIADSGEAEIVYCGSCDYAANVEKAETIPIKEDSGGSLPLEEVDTPGITSIEQVTDFLGVDASQCLKTMIYLADGKPVAVLVRGDHTLNEIKLQHALDCELLALADTETIQQVTKAPVGFAGPIDLGIPIIADHQVQYVYNAVVGGNRKDTHIKNANLGRDFQVKRFADLREAKAGDLCPKCDGTLESARGIEVGQVFKLGTKYSKPLKANFLDEEGRENPIVMGCYGIGVSRTVAAIIEQHHDENGICWPETVAPYHVVIVPVSFKDDQQRQTAEDLYGKLKQVGVEVVLDDRLERPGVKFKDADLIGFPYRITIGPKSLAQGNVELITRKTQEKSEIPIEQVVDKLTQLLGC